MKIKAVFVDLGGVLVLNKAKEVYEDFERRFGLSGEVIKSVFTFLHSGEKTKEELEKYLSENDIDPDVWTEFTAKFYSSEQRNDKLVDILHRARDKGMKIIYTSNNSAGLDKVLEKYNLLNLSDVVVNSSLAKVSKPDPDFWKLALVEASKLVAGITKEEILVLDDSLTNYESAINFGLKAVVYSESVNKEVDALLGCSPNSWLTG